MYTRYLLGHAGLLQSEISEKQARSIRYQLSIAKLPLAKDIDDFDFADTPVNESQLLFRSRATGCFVYRPQRCHGKKGRREPSRFTGRYPANSSVTTSNRFSTAGPNAVESATSVASRPVAINMRPMRGVL